MACAANFATCPNISQGGIYPADSGRAGPIGGVNPALRAKRAAKHPVSAPAKPETGHVLPMHVIEKIIRGSL